MGTANVKSSEENPDDNEEVNGVNGGVDGCNNVDDKKEEKRGERRGILFLSILRNDKFNICHQAFDDGIE
jgi:hypothetical protein